MRIDITSRGNKCMSARKLYRFRASDEEYHRIKENAKKANLNVSAYIRRMTCEGEIKVYDMKAINTLAMNFHKIGTNINQVAAMVNTTKAVYQNDIEEIQKQINSMEDTLDEFYSEFERNNKCR